MMKMLETNPPMLTEASYVSMAYVAIVTSSRYSDSMSIRLATDVNKKSFVHSLSLYVSLIWYSTSLSIEVVSPPNYCIPFYSSCPWIPEGPETEISIGRFLMRYMPLCCYNGR